MASDPDLISQIYEAAALPELWPSVLESLAGTVGSLGVCFIHRSERATSWVSSPRMASTVEDYYSEGWDVRDERPVPLINDHYTGFRVVTDYWSEDQLERMAIFTEFMRPRRLVGAAGCLIQGPRDDVFHIAVEGLPSYSAGRAALPFLEAVRPHLSRAITLTAQLQTSHASGVVQGLAAAGIGAAVVGADGKLRATNEDFAGWFGGDIRDLAGRIRLPDKAANQQLHLALALQGGSRSIPLRGERERAALHVVPLPGRAREVFESDGFALLIARAQNRAIPTAALLRLLFDLTPAEARLARLIAEGKTISEAARTAGVQANTARIQLKAIYAKTGFGRHSDLAVALSALGTREEAAD